MRLAIACVLLVGLAATRVHAQPEEPWLIVPVTVTTNDAWLESTSTRLRTELLEQGLETWSLPTERTRVEAQLSRASTSLSAAQIESWQAKSAAALQAMTLGDYTTALQDLDSADQLALGALDTLNRDVAYRQQVLDTCIYRVRAFIETDRERHARASAIECRKRVPFGDASQEIHPPWVTEMLGEIDRFQRRESGSILLNSDPSGCAARLNGIPVGETPVELKGLFEGDYVAEVQCDPERRGRIHPVRVGKEAAKLTIDTRLDRVLRSVPVVHLRYDSVAEAAVHSVDDAMHLVRIVPSGAIILVSMPTSAVVKLERIDVSADASVGDVSALVTIPSGSRGPSRGNVALAARALAGQQCVDYTHPKPRALDCADGSLEAGEEITPPISTTPTKRRPKGQFASGLTLFSLGSSALIASVALWQPRSNAGAEWANAILDGTGDTSAQSRWISLNRATVPLAAAGGGLLVASMPLILPNHAKTPWWAWLAGGVGVGAAAFSIAYGVTIQPRPETSCRSDSIEFDDAALCIQRAERTSASVFAAAAAAPLITIPLVYLLRRDPAVEPAVSVSRGSAELGVRGRF